MRSTTEMGSASTERGPLAPLIVDQPVDRAHEEMDGQVLERDVLGRRQLRGGAAEEERLLRLARRPATPRAP